MYGGWKTLHSGNPKINMRALLLEYELLKSCLSQYKTQMGVFTKCFNWKDINEAPVLSVMADFEMEFMLSDGRTLPIEFAVDLQQKRGYILDKDFTY